MSLSTMQIVKDRDIDKDKKIMDIDFNEFWEAYQPDLIRFPNRKDATLTEWNKRSPAARKAMLDYVKDKGVPKWKNPYFFVIDFPEPRQRQCQILSYADYYSLYGTTEEVDGWQRQFLPEQQKTIFVKN